MSSSQAVRDEIKPFHRLCLSVFGPCNYTNNYIVEVNINMKYHIKKAVTDMINDIKMSVSS